LLAVARYSFTRRRAIFLYAPSRDILYAPSRYTLCAPSRDTPNVYAPLREPSRSGVAPASGGDRVMG